MPTAPLLQRFVDDELAHAPALVERTLQGVLERLRMAPDRELIAGLQQRGTVFRAAFVDSLRERVAAELARADGGNGMAPPTGLGGLALMDESRVEIDVEISRVKQLIDAAAEWELRELQTFTSALIGQAHVSAESNPLQPTIYAAALWDAGCAVFASQAQQAALLRLAGPACAAHLKTAWAAACSRLERQGVTPSLFRTVVLPPSGAAMRHPAADSTAATAMAAPKGSDAMRSLLSAMPAGGGGQPRAAAARRPDDVSKPAGAGGEVLAPAEGEVDFEPALLGLDDLLRQLPTAEASPADAAVWTRRLAEPLHELAALARGNEECRLITLLARVFDALRLDAQLGPGLAAPVARLQVSALRAALRDRSAIVDSAQYPLWQLLDRIGEAGAAYPAASDPRAVALASFCHRVAEELTRSAAPTAELFRKALAKLDEFLAAQLQAQLRAAQGAVEDLLRAEQLQTLQEELVQRLLEQMKPLRPGVAVRRFITTAWSRVLATAMLRFGHESPTTQNYIALVDDLLWSVQTPDHPASRQRLAALLPGLLQRLRAGMALIALPQPEQQAMLDELMRVHTAALRLGEQPSADRPTATQIVQGIASEIERTAGGPHAAKSDGEAPGRLIDGASLETVPAELMPQRAPGAGGDSPQRQVAALRPAQRRRLFINGRWARVQLLWRSDAGGFFLFAGEMAGQTHSITRSALERLAEVGLLAPLEARPLVQRALASVTRQTTTLAGVAAFRPTGAPA